MMSRSLVAGLFSTVLWFALGCFVAAPVQGQAPAANPFAPSPTTPAPAAAPAAQPAAPAANPFGTPAAPAPTTPAPATPAPAANPFGAPTTPAPAPAANPFGAPTTPAPAAPAANPFGTPSTPAPAPSAPAPANTGSGAPTVPTMDGPPPSGGYRKLARGVETTIPSPVTAADRSSRHDVVELLAVVPTYGERPSAPGVAPAKAVYFKHDVWGLDFTFKPIRFIRVPDGAGKERLVWYMIYHVKNNGEKPFLFIPRFELQSHDVQQTYAEKILPDVIPLIRAREDKNRRLLSTTEITGEIPPSTADVDRSAWGVVTWEGIDPRTDRFSIYVHGLTNAYRWDDPPGAYKAGDPPATGRVYQQQVLKLNFWRPSDTRFEHEDEIRFGIPGDVDYAWLYQ
jgi:hypothetical protein